MKKPPYSTPHEAEAAFYEAFSNADLTTMMQVWDEGEPVVCIHPMGPRLEGHAAVRESWRQIFSGGARLRIKVQQTHISMQGTLALHVVQENLSVAGEQRPVMATNAYRLTADGWRMFLHHASPAPRNRAAEAADDTRTVH